MNTIKLDIECQSCGGTGVYVGMAECAGAAVVCWECKGTGKQKYVFKYTAFTKKKKRRGVKRVYKKSYGYVLSTGKVNFDGIGTIDMDKEGVSYQEFLDGMLPVDIRGLACPLLADQGKCHKIGFVDANGCNCLGQPIYRCVRYYQKHACWDKFDECVTKMGGNL